MELFKWKDSFNTGIDVIDQQHRDFLEMLNECIELPEHDKHGTVANELVNRLKAYSLKHFSHEENLLARCNYREFEQHVKQHQVFTSRVAELELAQQDGRNGDFTVLVSFMRDWFMNHILDHDMKYVPYVH
jgi:hemerythrin-like metal-binding protein